MSVVSTIIGTAERVPRAADALGLTTSAVSRAISRLEARVGVRLLEHEALTVFDRRGTALL
ncbi:helix-turn-helix domain-containing protein [Bradyrhizobium diazoefficiens]|uniref:helix-turn-helix domain-containing protein n=1 Tax=Bradyrhizobium diazoefficiens TaxID=1355477 RepID=UPI003D9BCFFD